MELVYHKNFIANLNKRVRPNSKLLKRFQNRLQEFIANPNNAVLKNHALTGSKKGLHSFSVNGDVRVIYRCYKNKIELYDIGSHNQVY